MSYNSFQEVECYRRASTWLRILEEDITREKAKCKTPVMFLKRMREKYVILPDYEKGFLFLYWENNCEVKEDEDHTDNGRM